MNYRATVTAEKLSNSLTAPKSRSALKFPKLYHFCWFLKVCSNQNPQKDYPLYFIDASLKSFSMYRFNLSILLFLCYFSYKNPLLYFTDCISTVLINLFLSSLPFLSTDRWIWTVNWTKKYKFSFKNLSRVRKVVSILDVKRVDWYCGYLFFFCGGEVFF